MIETPSEFKAVIEDWRRDLIARIQRAQLIFELADDKFDIAALEAEKAAFEKDCVVMWKGPPA